MKLGLLLLCLIQVLCTIDDLINGLSVPSVPIIEVFVKAARPHILTAVKGVIEEKYKEDPLISVPRQPLPAYLTP